jgi:hypothetical protein
VPLTGRFNFRRTLTGRIVVQVEEDKPVWWSRTGKTRRLGAGMPMSWIWRSRRCGR